MRAAKQNKKGFTLIELLVVIAVIGLLASVILVAVNNTRSKARDAKRRTDLKQLSTAVELYAADNNGAAPGVVGYFSNVANLNAFKAQLAQYASFVPNDPLAPTQNYLYMRKDWTGDWACETQAGLNVNTKYAFYAKLESPTSQDIASLSDGYDQCMYTNTNPQVNLRVGN